MSASIDSRRLAVSTTVHKLAWIIGGLAVGGIVVLALWDPVSPSEVRIPSLWDACRAFNLWVSPVAFLLVSRQAVLSFLGRRRRQELRLMIMMAGYVGVIALGSAQGWLGRDAGPATVLVAVLNAATIVLMLTWRTLSENQGD